MEKRKKENTLTDMAYKVHNNANIDEMENKISNFLLMRDSISAQVKRSERSGTEKHEGKREKRKSTYYIIL